MSGGSGRVTRLVVGAVLLGARRRRRPAARHLGRRRRGGGRRPGGAAHLRRAALRRRAATPRRSSAFRRYVEMPEPDAANLYDTELFTTEGAPVGHARAHRDPRPLRRRGLGSRPTTPSRARPTTPSSGSGRRSTTPPRVAPSTCGSPSARATPGSGCPTIGALQSVDLRDRAPRAFRYNLAAARASYRPGCAPGDRYTFTAVVPRRRGDRRLEAVGADRDAGRRRPPFLDAPAPSGPRASPTRWGACSRSPTTCAPRASTPTASLAARADLPPRALRRAPRRRLRQRLAHGRQRRAVRRRHGAAGQQGRRPGPRRPRCRRARRRGRPRQGRAGVGRAAGGRRVVAGAADRDVHGHRQSRRSSRPGPSSAQRPGHPAAGPGAAAVDPRRADRRRDHGAQGAPRRRRARRGRRAPGLGARRCWSTAAGRCSPCSWSPGRSSPPRRCAAPAPRTSGPSSGRIAGAWRELVDHARDLGSAGAGRRASPAASSRWRSPRPGPPASRAPPTSASSGRPSRAASEAESFWGAVDAERRALSAASASPRCAELRRRAEPAHRPGGG